MMSFSRELAPVERAIDTFDRTFGTSFTTIVALRGPLDERELEGALRAVERRHPILRARIDRREGVRFVVGEAPPIPLRWVDAAKEEVDAYAAEALSDESWTDDGPRAAATLMRHALGHSTLLFTLHHVVGDAISGVIVVRDILRAIADELPEGEVEPSTQALVEAVDTEPAGLVKAGIAFARSRLVEPFRLGGTLRASRQKKRIVLHAIDLDPEQTEQLVMRAKRANTTVHGVLVAAIGLAIAEEGAGSRPLRALHTIDMRRALGRGEPSLLADSVGYYGGSVETDFVVREDVAIESLAGTISRGVRAKRPHRLEDVGARVATALGPALRALARLSPRAIEQRLLARSFAITNVGRLEPHGLAREMGDLRVKRALVVAAASVVDTLFASAATFDGMLSVRIGACEPSVSSDVSRRITDRVRFELARFVGA